MDYIMNETTDNSYTQQVSLYFCIVDDNMDVSKLFSREERGFDTELIL